MILNVYNVYLCYFIFFILFSFYLLILYYFIVCFIYLFDAKNRFQRDQTIISLDNTETGEDNNAVS